MSSKPTITTFSGDAKYSTSVLNANFTALRNAFENILGRSGTSGTDNAMTGDLDMAGFTLRNVTFEGDVIGVEWQGSWVTATDYAVNDLVFNTDSTYICVVAHTSGTFATDYAANKWELFATASQAISGIGLQIVEAADATEVQQIINTEVGVDVQAFDAALADIAAITFVQGDILYQNATDLVALAAGTAGQVLQTGGAAANPSWTYDPFKSQLLHVREEQAANTAGGTFTSGSFVQRTLNTSKTNEITGASLASSTITLPAGTYFIEAMSPAHACDSHVAKLRNTTDNSDTIIGQSAYSNSTNGMTTFSNIKGRFTIAGAKDFQIQHRCTTTKSGNGLGAVTNFAVAEVYTEVLIWKLA